jgi:hypothetical protein
MKAAFPARYYVEACPFTPPADSPLLRCVHFDTDGSIVAIDGHIGFFAHPPVYEGQCIAPADTPINIPIDANLLGNCRPGKKEHFERYITLERGNDAKRLTIQVILADSASTAVSMPATSDFIVSTWTTTISDNKYPAWRNLMPRPPTSPPERAPSFDFDLLKRFSHTIRPYNPRHPTPAKVNSRPITLLPTADETIWLDLGREDAFGLLMPVRQDRSQIPPTWISQTPPKPQSQAA